VTLAWPVGALLGALLGACSSGHEPPPRPSPAQASAEATATGPLDRDRSRARSSSTETAPAAPTDPAANHASDGTSVIPATARQLITGITADWDATTVTLRRWHRRGGAWIADGSAWRGVIGKTGAAWGSGLHGDGAPGGHSGPSKREGDGKSPAGAFEIRSVYGYAATPPARTVLPYTQVTSDWQCVDDPASHYYTQILDRSGVSVDWSSAEQMRRHDELYTWVIDIAHNRARAPGAGSCIFFHVWRGPESSTVGCTAMPEPKLAQLIGGLDATAVYVLLPRTEYDAFAAPWGLPPGEK
jgi:zinc D-Ala-D-Ala dipeptidase